MALFEIMKLLHFCFAVSDVDDSDVNDSNGGDNDNLYSVIWYSVGDLPTGWMAGRQAARVRINTNDIHLVCLIGFVSLDFSLGVCSLGLGLGLCCDMVWEDCRN